MGAYGSLAPYGLFRYGAAPSYAEQIYASQVAMVTDPKSGVSPFDLTPGTYFEGRLYARAIVHGHAREAIEYAGVQSDETQASGPGLTALEGDYLVTPSPSDGEVARRARLTTLKQANPGGAKLWSVVAALRTLLGASFLAYVPSARMATPVLVPANPPGSDPRVHATRTDLPPKLVRLVDPVAPAATVARIVRYANLLADDDEVVLGIGDVVMVQPDNTVVAERLAVTATGGTAGARTATLAFAKAHHAGAVMTTGNWPWQTTTSRQNMIVVDAATAANPTKRRMIDALMPKLLRSVSGWAIVSGDPYGNVAQFLLNVTPLGTGTLTPQTYSPSP